MQEINHDQEFVASVLYLDRLELYKEEKPYMVAFVPAGFNGTISNHQYSQHEVVMTDVRGIEGRFSLSTHGFQFLRWKTSLSLEDFDDDTKIRDLYYPEIVEQVQQIFTDAVEIHALTHMIRKRPDPSLYSAHNEEDSRKLSPILYAHGDFTPTGACASLEQSLFPKHGHLRGKRVQIVNVWRLLQGPNRDHPLALCDYTTVSTKDVELNDVIHQKHVGESMRAYHNPNHRWYFLGDQEADEIVLFRNCDSGDENSPFAFHLAFEDPRQKSMLPARESIETRLAVFS